MNARGASRATGGAALVLLAAVYVFAAWRDSARAPHLDEIEHLHVAVLMARGLEPYRDFSEHHPPLFWGMLRPLVTATEGTAQMQALVARARILAVAAAAIALIAAAAIVWWVSANLWSVVTFLGLVFAAGGVWWNGLGDVRPDSAALAFWWSGAALVLVASRPSIRGVGMGLVCVAALVKPQWPISSVVITAWFFMRGFGSRKAMLTAVAAAGSVCAAGLVLTALLADLGVVYFHVVTQTSFMLERTSEWKEVARPWFFACPPLFRPQWIALAGAALLAAAFRSAPPFVRRHKLVALLTIAVASLLEIVFVYPYPSVDFRYYAFWSIVAAALLALLPRAAASVLPKRLELLRNAVPVAAGAIALLLSHDIVGPARTAPDPYWRYVAWMERQLAPGDTVWNGMLRHPIDARDASYYWFGMPDVIAPALALARTERGRRFLPPIAEVDLPPCRVERGLDRDVRFMARPLDVLPVTLACFERLQAAGRVTRTSYRHLWLVQREKARV